MKAKELLERINKLEYKYKIKDFKKGEVIFYQGSKCENVCIILKGEIKMNTIINNSDVTYNVFDDYDIFGNNLIYATTPIYQATIVANKKSKIALFNKEDLNKLFNDVKFKEEYLRLLADQTLKDKQRLQLLQIPHLKDRINEMFNYYNGVITIKNTADLAYFLSSSRETLSRLLSKLSKEKLLEKHKNYIVRIKKTWN